MDEIIASILDAEQKVEEILARAAGDCRRLSLEGAERAAKVKEDAVSLLAAERERSARDAESRANAAYDRLAEEGGAAAQALKNRCRDKADAAADAVLRRLFG